jgi:hypothetical protein
MNYALKITGSAELDRELDSEKEIDITAGTLSIYSVEHKDNFDGEKTIVYKSKFTSAIDLVQERMSLKGKPKNKKSIAMRKAIYILGLEEGNENDNEELFYDVVMDKIILNLPEIWEKIRYN